MNQADSSNHDAGEIDRSLVIPVYNNAENIPELLPALKRLSDQVGARFEVVFVVDGSPDTSGDLLRQQLPAMPFSSQLVFHSRNYGAFTAIRTGMEFARGRHIAVMAADLQEPPELIGRFFQVLDDDAADIVFGQRISRDDGAVKNFLSNTYWTLYQKIAFPDIPKGGVDVFACNRVVRDSVLAIEEPNSSLVAQLFWIGYRRIFVPYERQKRIHGTSAWSFRKRFRYMLDSIFSYSDFPIMVVLWVGLIGLLITFAIGIFTIAGKLLGAIDVPGYAALLLSIQFFGSSILIALGMIGSYVWRTLENTKKRPLRYVSAKQSFSPPN